MYGGHIRKERYIPRHLIANEINPLFCECLPVVLCNPFRGCDTTCWVNRKGKRPTVNWLHIYMLSNLKKKTSHKYNLDGSVEVARIYALLSYGKKRRYIDTFDELHYTMARTTDKSTTVLPPTEYAFKEHVFCAKWHALNWCKSNVRNQELIKPVVHIWSACDDGLITPKMHNLLLLRFET